MRQTIVAVTALNLCLAAMAIVIYFAGFILTALLFGAVSAVAIVIMNLRTSGLSTISKLETIYAIILSYVCLVLLFSFLYYRAVHADRNAFSFRDIDDTSLIYFSITTLATVGYGDIYPISSQARLLVVLEILISHIYNLVVFGLLSTYLATNSLRDVSYETFIKRAARTWLIMGTNRATKILATLVTICIILYSRNDWPFVRPAILLIGSLVMCARLLFFLANFSPSILMWLAIVMQAVPAYILLGGSFAEIYGTIAANDANAFSMASLGTYDLLYFSLVTQSTVGFGDIVPRSDLARAFVCLQIVTGQVFNVVALGLVASYLSKHVIERTLAPRLRTSTPDELGADRPDAAAADDDK
jgi:hypothetical protein